MRCIFTSLFVASLMAHAADDPQQLITSGKWSSRFAITGFSGQDGFAPVVYDFAKDTNGKVLATGRFDWMGKRSVEPLVRLDGDRWRPAKKEWQIAAPEIGFSAIAVNEDGHIALSRNSGPFGRVPSEIWLDTGNEMRVIGHLQGSVRSMVWFKGNLWVAGAFVMQENNVAGLALWDGTTWSTPPGGSPNAAVYRLYVSGDSLFAAGDFSTIGGIPARGVAEWNSTSWKAYDLGADITAAHVYSVIRSDNGDVFVGGAITGGVLRWNGTNWERLGGGVFSQQYQGVVSDMVMHKGALYVTGCFSHLNAAPADPAAIPAQSVGRWTGDRWESLDDGSKPVSSVWFEYRVCGDEPNEFTVWDMRYQRLFSDGERVLLGGMMPGVDGVASQSIAAFDGQEWKTFGEARSGLSGSAREVTSGGPGNDAYVFGSISHAGGEPGKSGVFRYSGGWEPVGGPLPADLQCSTLAVDRAGTAFLGCNSRPTMGQQPRSVVLRQDGDNWIPLEPLAPEGLIMDMQFDSAGVLWVAGGVRLGPDSGSGFLARMEGSRLTIVEDGFNSMVFRIAFPPNAGVGAPQVLVGGAFTQIEGSPYARIARWSNGRWEALGSSVPSAVLALAWGEEAVFVSTEKPSDPNGKQLLLGRWDGSQWLEIGTPENGLPAPRENTTHGIRDLLAVGRYLFLVGSIWPESGGRNAFVYDGSRISALAGGVDAIGVDSVAIAGRKLWFGGDIAEVGAGDEQVSSVGIARFSASDPLEEDDADLP